MATVEEVIGAYSGGAPPPPPPDPPTRVALSTLARDEFTTLDTATDYPESKGTVQSNGSELVVYPGSELKTEPKFDVRGDRVAISGLVPSVIESGDPLIRAVRLSVVASDDDSKFLSYRWMKGTGMPAGGRFELHRFAGTGDPSPLIADVPVGATAMALAFDQAAGQVTAEWSDDGVTWTALGSKETTGLDLGTAACKVAVGCETQSGSGTASPARVGALWGESALPAGGVSRVQEVSGEGSATVTLTWPTTPTAGNLLVAAFAFDKWIDPAKVTHPSGWSKLAEVNGNEVSMLLYAKIAAGSETTVTATETGSGTGPRNVEGWAAEIAGLAADVTPEALLNPAIDNTARTTVVLGPSSALAADSYALAFAAIDTASGTWGATASDDFTGIHDATHSSGAGPGLAVFERPEVASGATVGTTVTSPVSDQMHALAVAFERVGSAVAPPSITWLTDPETDPGFDPANPVFDLDYQGDDPTVYRWRLISQGFDAPEEVIGAWTELTKTPPAEQIVAGTNLTVGTNYRLELEVSNTGGGPFTYTREWSVPVATGWSVGAVKVAAGGAWALGGASA